MRKIFYILFTAFALAACKKEECVDCNFEPVYPKEFTRVYLHYMAMDNSLTTRGDWGDVNINEMYRGATAESLNGGAIFIFRDVPNENSQIIMICWDPMDRTMIKVVRKDYGANLDSADPDVLEMVIEDVDEMADAPSWALGFGSHGMGWVPREAYEQYIKSTSRAAAADAGMTQTRYLIDNGSEANFMECGEFAGAVINAMPFEAGRRYDFILMDLCYMGSIEFAYLLEDAADYLIFSPAEIIAKGFPYDRIVDDIFNTEDVRAGVEQICQEYYNFYNEPNVYGNYATISLVDCSKIGPMVTVMQELVLGKQAQIEAIDIDALVRGRWHFDEYIRSDMHITFDLRKFVQELGGHPGFDAALAEMVPYCDTTGKSLNGSMVIPKANFSGLSTYIPVTKNAKYTGINEYYRLTDWAQAIYPPGSL